MLTDTHHPVSFRDIAINNGFWANRQTVFRDITIQAILDRFAETGRFDSLRLDRKDGQPSKLDIFRESDITKWIEGAAYFLQHNDMPELEARIDDLVHLMEEAQDEDGYLNDVFPADEQKTRLTQSVNHDLYYAGHLIEAGLAYAEATGKVRLLDIGRRYVDLIDRSFHDDRSTIQSRSGHQEIELALLKLYNYTKEKRYLVLAQYLLENRGKSEQDGIYNIADLEYLQSLLPVREQESAEGNAVRALYLATSLAELALMTDDRELMASCDTLFENIVHRHIHFTGGIGSTHRGESFTYDNDLFEYTTFNETCGAIALMMFCSRMWICNPDRKYADVAELALYNAVLAGVSLSGDHFFKMQPLAVDPARIASNNSNDIGLNEHQSVAERDREFDRSFSPPNLLRLVGSIADYMYSVQGRTIFAHCYMGGRATIDLGGKAVRLFQETRYPNDGTINIFFEDSIKTGLGLRIPGWCNNWQITVNGEIQKLEIRDGYAYLERNWQVGDHVVLDLEMVPQFYRSNPRVTALTGKVAVARGPLVYCIESVDHPGIPIRDVRLHDVSEYELHWAKTDWLEFRTIKVNARYRSDSQELFYSDAEELITATINLIPYFSRANRGLSEMSVWFLKD